MSQQRWLPTSQQMSDAVQLRQHAYTNITMRQALGMIVLLALLAGLLPFVSNWLLAVRLGTILPLAQATQASQEMGSWMPMPLAGVSVVEPQALSDFFLTAAGLDQLLADWLAGGLSALGAWINWPLHWISIWIVYGALVMVANKALGATMTLQRFYAATGYAAVPLLLTGLSPIPCLGPLATVVGSLWAMLVYVRANQDVTNLSLLQAAVAAMLPAAVLLFVGLILFGLTVLTFVITSI